MISSCSALNAPFYVVLRRASNHGFTAEAMHGSEFVNGEWRQLPYEVKFRIHASLFTILLSSLEEDMSVWVGLVFAGRGCFFFAWTIFYAIISTDFVI